MISPRTLRKFASRFPLRNVSKRITSCHSQIQAWCSVHCAIGGTQGPLGYVSALGARRLVHWLILMTPSCLRSHNACYIMLKSLNKTWLSNLMFQYLCTVFHHNRNYVVYTNQFHWFTKFNYNYHTNTAINYILWIAEWNINGAWILWFQQTIDKWFQHGIVGTDWSNTVSYIISLSFIILLPQYL